MNLKFFFDTENDVLNHRPESAVLNFAPAMYTVGYDELKGTPRPRRTGGDGCLQGRRTISGPAPAQCRLNTARNSLRAAA